jgi:putative ABC transport system permease protein
MLRLPPVDSETGEPTSEGSAERRAAFYNLVGEEFFTVFEMELLAGRSFSRERGEDITAGGAFDSTRTVNIVVDRALIEELGFESPALAIDELIYEIATDPPTPLRIIGVIESKPLHFVGLGATSNIYAFDLDMENEIVRISHAGVSTGLASIDELWDRLSPNMSLSSYFVDDLFEESYENFGRANYIFSALALFALLISAMGLAATAVHVGSQRIHEIGVRKTMGATTAQIIAMLLRDFGNPVLIANIIAWPFAYIAARAYLGVFLHQIDLTLWPFVAGLLVTTLVAWITVGGLVLRVSSVRPADVLRAE